MSEFVPFFSQEYFILLALALFGRGMDFLSTWIATPNLVLEANPIARKLGWRAGIALNLIICLGIATAPLPALMVTTTSVLVAARNLQSAWLMRALGEEGYRFWFGQRLSEVNLRIYLFCLFLQTALIAGVGAGLVLFSPSNLIPVAVGMGIITYALAVLIFTLLALGRIRRVN